VTVTVDEFEVADPADAWTRAGFSVDGDGVCRIGDVRVRLVGLGGGTGIVGWSLRGLPPDRSPDDLDGVPTKRSGAPPAAPAAHPNGVIAIDHVVLLSPDLGRTVAALAAVGVNPRRERDAELGGRPIRQIFFRFGEVVIEAVGSPDTASEGPSTSGGSRTSSQTSTRLPRSSVTTQHRSRTRCNPLAGSPRSDITSSACRSGRR
jgi:hypothetical protein